MWRVADFYLKRLLVLLSWLFVCDMLCVILSAGLACHEFQQSISAEQLNEQTGPAEA